MQQFAEPVTDAKGNAIAGALVTVFNLDGTLAPLFAADGVTGINNPVTTSRDGIALFCAANGNYRRRVTVDGRNLDVPGQIVLNAPSVNVTDAPFHARGDGLPHPLSERFATLAEAQAAYPHARALTDSQDWAAIQGAINTGRAVYLPKPAAVYMLNRELLIVTAGQAIRGDGPGYGLSPNIYKPSCGLMWFGTGERYVMTRRLNRIVASDPTDAPISANINIQAESVLLEGFSILLQTDFNNAADYGAEWDVGVMNGSRPGQRTKSVHIIGYHRIANYYQDVTRANNLPEFTTPYGVTFPRSTVNSGSDGMWHEEPLWSGGRWVEVCLGALDNPSTLYYNEATNTQVLDSRGSSGVSDGAFYNYNLRAAGHHSGKRWVDPLPALNNVAEGFSAGAQYLDAYAANKPGIATKRTYIQGRMVSSEPFISRIDRFGDVRYISPHHEWRSSTIIPAAGGGVVDPRDTDLYGYGTISLTPRSGTVAIISPTTNIPSDRWFWNIVSNWDNPERANRMLLGSSWGVSRFSKYATMAYDGVLRVAAMYPGNCIRLDGVDLNTLVEPADYRVTSPINAPFTASGLIHVRRDDSGNVLQEAIVSGGGSASLDVKWYRKFAGSWRPWYRITSSQDRTVTVLASSAVGVTGTAVTTEETYASVLIPANALGLNGQLRITTLWSATNSANIKTVSVKFGAVAFLSNNITTNASTQEQTIIRNRGVLNSQVGHGLTLTSFGGTTNAVVTSAIDTSVDQTLLITGQKAVAGELLKLESYTVEILPS